MENTEIEWDDSDEQEDELFEHLRIVVDKGQSPLRIDKFLMNRIENASRSRIQSGAEAGFLRVNDIPVKSNYKVKPFDVITLVLPKEPRDTEVHPENIPINIIFEDDHLLVLDKEPGMVVHPGFGNYTGTLVNALVYHLNNLPTGKNGEGRPGLVHRIDKNTSGLLVIAKTEKAMTKIAKEFFDRTVDRKYTALVWGDLEGEGVIEGHIGRSLKDRRVMDVFVDGEYGKNALTRYKVLERFGYVTLVECKLETGRTHQIRAHFKHIGHPLFNDETYGGDKILKGTTFAKYKSFVENCFKILPRQALHARTLGFFHPETGEKLFFEAGLPKDLDQLLDKWRKYAATSIDQQFNS